jgi:hypothetical protein
MNTHLLAFINDAYRFVLFHRDIIRGSALNIYNMSFVQPT